MEWLRELAEAVGQSLIPSRLPGELLRLAATYKMVEFYEKHCGGHGNG
jgi:hypothetical protein